MFLIVVAADIISTVIVMLNYLFVCLRLGDMYIIDLFDLINFI